MSKTSVEVSTNSTADTLSNEPIKNDNTILQYQISKNKDMTQFQRTGKIFENGKSSNPKPNQTKLSSFQLKNYIQFMKERLTTTPKSTTYFSKKNLTEAEYSTNPKRARIQNPTTHPLECVTNKNYSIYGSYLTNRPMTFQTASGHLDPPTTYMYGFKPMTTTAMTQPPLTPVTPPIPPPPHSLRPAPTSGQVIFSHSRDRASRSLASRIYQLITGPVVRLVAG